MMPNQYFAFEKYFVHDNAEIRNEVLGEVEQMFGTFGAAYRQYGKKLNMRAKGTENAFYIDKVWEELCEAVPLLDWNAEFNFLG